MGILQVQNIDLSFGDRTLLSSVSLTLGEHARAALAGGNGEGKSTLMKIVAGLMRCDGGQITKTRGMRVSYLPQSDIVLREATVYQEIEKGFSRFQENLDRQHEIESLLQCTHTEALLVELNELQESLLDSRYYDREQTISLVAKGLGFAQKDLERPCSEFSGGYQMRIALAKVLCEDPDLMMLDEPTNYLDIEARLWLENYMKTYRGSLLIVCHDKGFLDATVNEVYELFNARLTRYSGNDSFYEKQRQQEIEQLEEAYRRQQEEIGRTEQFIERFRYKATKSRQVQSRIRMLDRIEPVVVPSHLKTLNFSFPEPPHSPNDVVIVRNLTKRYGSQVVFSGFDMIVNKGQRLAVTGHNGIGKSTLLRIVAGNDSDISGEARLGPGVRVGYFSQDAADSLDMDGTVLDQVSAYGTEGQMRNALGSFLFSGDDVYKKVCVLSGGERSRLALLKILLQPASLLILDEPTNHLDINSKDMLLKALQKYTGTIVFVSHDAYFIKAIADRILYLSDGEPEFFNGDYDYFQWKLDQRLGIGSDDRHRVDSAPSARCRGDDELLASFNFRKTSTAIDRAEANRLRNRRIKMRGELRDLMEKVDSLEVRIAEVDALMDISENYSNVERIKALADRKAALEGEKDVLELQWMEKTEAYEAEFGPDDD